MDIGILLMKLDVTEGQEVNGRALCFGAHQCKICVYLNERVSSSDVT